jgi:hypothetical protein
LLASVVRYGDIAAGHLDLAVPLPSPATAYGFAHDLAR